MLPLAQFFLSPCIFLGVKDLGIVLLARVRIRVGVTVRVRVRVRVSRNPNPNPGRWR